MYNGVYTIDQFAYVHDTLEKWIADKIKGESLGDKLIALGITKIAIYGANKFSQMVYTDIKDRVEIVCYIDKNAEKYCGHVGQSKVIGLNELGCINEDTYVLIVPEFYFGEILNDLIKQKIDLYRIISLSMVV